MATMFARGSSPLSPSSSNLENPKRKRKYRSEPPVSDPYPAAGQHSRDMDLPNYPLFPADGHSTCQACHNRVCVPRDDIGLDADWSDLTESQLEETVLTNLDVIIKAAIKTILSYGVSEEAATAAVFSSGVFYGAKDTMTNMVENAMTLLRSGRELECPMRLFSPAEMRGLERRVLAEMVSVICEMRPTFSIGNAMWCLLISDMNVTHACSVECDVSTAPIAQKDQIFFASKVDVKEEKPTNEVQLKPTISFPRIPLGTELPVLTFMATNDSKENSSIRDLPNKEPEHTSSSSYRPEMKTLNGRKGHFGNSRRDRTRSAHLEKGYRIFGPKPGPRAGKHGLGGLLLKEKKKLESQTHAIKNAMQQLSKEVEAEPYPILEFTSLPQIPSADTELSLSLSTPSYEASWASRNHKAEMVMRLVHRVQELEAQLQQWTDWGQQKVMQAARRLGKDKPELQSLRQEKEAAEKIKRERQLLEENTKKKLAEMDTALSKASSQVEATNVAAIRLQADNNELRKVMEAAKEKAAESAARCQVMASREAKIVKESQSWEKQKALLHEELASERRKLPQMQQQLQQATENRDQVEARLKQEQKSKDDVLLQARNERKQREQIELSGRSQENAMILEAETDTQRYKDEVKKLEQQISQLRLMTDSSKTVSLIWERKDNKGPSLPDFLDFLDSEDVQRDRECVMCLTEEMSVVFLPCAHQVVCRKCNDLHQKQGFSDCPSCRTPIARRIYARFAKH